MTYTSAMREQYMRSGEGFLLVYSITSRSSFAEMATFHQQVLRVKDMDYFPMVMVANKCDLEKERQVSTMDGYAMAKKIGCPFVETSAKQRLNVDEAFNDLVREIRRFMRNQPPLYNAAPSSATPGEKGASAHFSQDGEKKGCKGCVII